MKFGWNPEAGGHQISTQRQTFSKILSQFFMAMGLHSICSSPRFPSIIPNNTPVFAEAKLAAMCHRVGPGWSNGCIDNEIWGLVKTLVPSEPQNSW